MSIYSRSPSPNRDASDNEDRRSNNSRSDNENDDRDNDTRDLRRTPENSGDEEGK